MASLDELIGLESSEQLRVKFLKQEFKLRKKQPEAWTKTKYRPYANFRTKKKEDLFDATAGTKQVQVVKA
ncbi:MAG: hypothetical protein HY544_02965 [Candidatus Diapherotrites archaeon]|uniref:Uncharacterized protein n=1 Tax=Candidatus Iainarchaeum sp. TaxID=3101447 RepID=A0A8T3YNQ3_9ARCH|nr:hypothetical protein [Candidatus Diapherotrites archaeon]